MKDKAIILDFNILAEENLSVEEFISLYYLYNNINSDKFLEDLQEKGFIKIIQDEKNNIILREKAKLLIEFLEIESLNSVKKEKVIKKSKRIVTQEVLEFVDEFRNKWKGLKPGSMGSFESCKEKLMRWMLNNPTYSKEQILKAVDIYINSLTNLQYLQQADYFIYKKEGKDEHSRLSAFVDETEIIQEGWTSKLN